jgi:hypothetical protein
MSSNQLLVQSSPDGTGKTKQGLLDLDGIAKLLPAHNEVCTPPVEGANNNHHLRIVADFHQNRQSLRELNA